MRCPRAQSVFERGDDEAEVHEYLENCCKGPMHHGEQTLFESGIRIWNPNNDLTQSRRRVSSATEVPARQWDALKLFVMRLPDDYQQAARDALFQRPRNPCGSRRSLTGASP
jgi:hypothetical protein